MILSIHACFVVSSIRSIQTEGWPSDIYFDGESPADRARARAEAQVQADLDNQNFPGVDVKVVSLYEFFQMQALAAKEANRDDQA